MDRGARSKMAKSFEEGRRPDRRELDFFRVGKMGRDKIGGKLGSEHRGSGEVVCRERAQA